MMPRPAPVRGHMREGTPQDELRAVRDAYRTAMRRSAAGRSRLADRFAEMERRHREYRTETERRIDELERQIEDLRVRLEAREREIETLLNTKTFRYTAAIRGVYGQIRSWFRR
jgi:predicted  nucleic acid-binding Zn-ribbon protein